MPMSPRPATSTERLTLGPFLNGDRVLVLRNGRLVPATIVGAAWTGNDAARGAPLGLEWLVRLDGLPRIMRNATHFAPASTVQAVAS